MLDQQQRSRLAELRLREQDNVLTERERTELDGLLQEVEAAEAAYLVPATERIRRESETVEARNRKLDGLVSRKQRLLERLRDFLAEAQTEQRVIDRELAAVLAGRSDSDTEL